MYYNRRFTVTALNQWIADEAQAHPQNYAVYALDHEVFMVLTDAPFTGFDIFCHCHCGANGTWPNFIHDWERMTFNPNIEERAEEERRHERVEALKALLCGLSRVADGDEPPRFQRTPCP